MLPATDFLRQARLCARLAEECDEPHLADRFRRMAADLSAKAEDCEDLRAFRFRWGTLAAA